MTLSVGWTLNANTTICLFPSYHPICVEKDISHLPSQSSWLGVGEGRGGAGKYKVFISEHGIKESKTVDPVKIGESMNCTWYCIAY